MFRVGSLNDWMPSVVSTQWCGEIRTKSASTASAAVGAQSLKAITFVTVVVVSVVCGSDSRNIYQAQSEHRHPLKTHRRMRTMSVVRYENRQCGVIPMDDYARLGGGCTMFFTRQAWSHFYLPCKIYKLFVYHSQQQLLYTIDSIVISSLMFN